MCHTNVLYSSLLCTRYNRIVHILPCEHHPVDIRMHAIPFGKSGLPWLEPPQIERAAGKRSDYRVKGQWGTATVSRHQLGSLESRIPTLATISTRCCPSITHIYRKPRYNGRFPSSCATIVGRKYAQCSGARSKKIWPLAKDPAADLVGQ